MSFLDAAAGWTSGSLLAEGARTWAAIVEHADGLPGAEFTAETGNGSVTAVADGYGRLVEVRVPALALRHADPDRLAGQLLAAIRQVEREADRHREAALDAVTFAGWPLGRLAAELPTPEELLAYLDERG